jgi:hypothetical protein
MNEFFRDIGAEETDWETVPRKGESDLTMSSGNDPFKFF